MSNLQEELTKIKSNEISLAAFSGMIFNALINNAGSFTEENIKDVAANALKVKQTIRNM